jgi:hypothetical protein
MLAVLGFAMILTGILIIRAAKLGTQLEPPPWWASDRLATNLLVPMFAGLCGAGIASILAWLDGGHWRATEIVHGAGAVVALAAFALLWYLMSAWKRRAGPSSL